MDREEAIKQFKHWYEFGYCKSETPSSEVLGMAIEALHQPEVVRCGECKYHRDWISEHVWCTRGINDDMETIPVPINHFCSYGRRTE